MLIKFTNATEEFKGNPIYINSDHITVVYELVKMPNEKPITVVFGGPTGLTWSVEESLQEVIDLVGKHKSSCGCK